MRVDKPESQQDRIDRERLEELRQERLGQLLRENLLPQNTPMSVRPPGIRRAGR